MGLRDYAMESGSTLLKKIKAGDKLPFDLVLERGRISFPKGTTVTEEILKILQSGTVLKVSLDAPIVDRMPERVITTDPKSTSGQKLKLALIQKKAREAMNSTVGSQVDPPEALTRIVFSLWSESETGFEVEEILQAVEAWIDSLRNSENGFAFVYHSKNSENYIPNHTINSAGFAALTAINLGLNIDETINITIAGLFHDIGELFIEKEILFRKAPLTNSDLKKLREHPRQSVEWMKRAGFGNEDIQRLVLRHHERHDGSGYPYNITGKVIGRDDFILAFSDMYCAMICPRPYRAAHSRRYALRTILKGKDSLFNGEYIETIGKILGLYPPGSIVELKSGRIALVLNPPEDGTWQAVSFSIEPEKEFVEMIDLNNLSGDFIVREYA